MLSIDLLGMILWLMIGLFSIKSSNVALEDSYTYRIECLYMVSRDSVDYLSFYTLYKGKYRLLTCVGRNVEIFIFKFYYNNTIMKYK